MIRRLALAGLIALFPALASAQFAIIGPTQPTADNGDRLATTAWVNNFVSGGIPLPSGNIFIGSAGNIATAQTMSADATISILGALTLATVNANVGTFGSVTQCITTTQNAKGLTTAISAATCTPAVGSITGLGTGIATALGVNVGTAGAPVVNGGALGTPSSGTLTNATGLPTTGLTGVLQAAQEPAHTGDMTNSASSLATTVLKTNGVAFTTYATATQGQLPGIASNTAATAGNIGEHVSATLVQGSAISLTTATTVNLVSISLTTGEWDVSGTAYFNTAASTNVAFLYGSSSTTSATLSSVAGQFFQTQLNFVPGAGTNALNINPFRLSLSGTTTVFFTVQGGFTVSTLTVFGYLRATRVH